MENIKKILLKRITNNMLIILFLLLLFVAFMVLLYHVFGKDTFIVILVVSVFYLLLGFGIKKHCERKR